MKAIRGSTPAFYEFKAVKLKGWHLHTEVVVVGL